ncbi:hypothetical protein COO60DRAFT_441775 [Scenedesmus sp. NREL 46B-D3]|nr:hypothetical protein COO60DRAFT_441775 [Scenedesmus sp. NREL 46B-D3]
MQLYHVHSSSRRCCSSRGRNSSSSSSRRSQTRAKPQRTVHVTAVAGKPTAVITGCSTGIGRESALLLAQKGWNVFAGARSESDLQQLGQLAAGITPVRLDVTSQESVAAAQRLVEASVQGAGLQLLVNNAGICTVAPVEFFDLQSFRPATSRCLCGVPTAPPSTLWSRSASACATSWRSLVCLWWW